MRDLRYAVRNLRSTPFVNAVAVLSLALGIGANAAIYSLFEQILLRPLPVPAPQELYKYKEFLLRFGFALGSLDIGRLG